MANTLLATGGQNVILQNVIYALPASLTHITASVAIEVSVDGSTWDVLTGADTVGAFCSAAFVRCTTGFSVLHCKRS